MSRKNRIHPSIPSSIIDVVVTTAGRFDELEKCLNALYREAQTIHMSIFIVDDNSPAEDRNLNKHLFEYQPLKDPARGVVNFKVIHHTQSEGFPKSANDGGRLGKSPLIMFISDDVELRERAVTQVVRRMDDPTIGICGIKLLFPLNSTDQRMRPAGKVQHIGLTLNIRGEPVHPLVGWNPEHPKCCVSRDMWATTGACLTIRRNLFSQIGGFNVIYGKGTFEDCELAMSVRKLGKRVFVDVDAQGYHYVGATVEKKREGYPLQQNFMTFQARWAQSGMLYWEEMSIW